MKRFASIVLFSVLGIVGVVKADDSSSHYNFPPDGSPIANDVREGYCDIVHGGIDLMEKYNPFTSNAQLEHFRQEHVEPDCPRVQTPSYNSNSQYRH